MLDKAAADKLSLFSYIKYIPVLIAERKEVVDGAKTVSYTHLIFFNFRPDRARELTRTFIQKDFEGFARKKGYFPVHFVSFTQYDATFSNLEVRCV